MVDPEHFEAIPTAPDLRDDGGLTVGYPTSEDAQSVFEILSDPAMPFVTDPPPTRDAAAGWIADLEEHAGQSLPERTILWLIKLDGVAAGTLTTALYTDIKRSDPASGMVRTVEYTAYRRPALVNRGVCRRAINLVEPLLVEHYAVEQVVAWTHERNGEAQNALRTFNGPLLYNAKGMGFYARDIPRPAR